MLRDNAVTFFSGLTAIRLRSTMSRNRSEGLRGVLSLSVSLPPPVCVNSRYRDRSLMAFNWPSLPLSPLVSVYRCAFSSDSLNYFYLETLTFSFFSKETFIVFAILVLNVFTLRDRERYETMQERDWKILAVSESRSKSRNPLSLLYPWRSRIPFRPRVKSSCWREA